MDFKKLNALDLTKQIKAVQGNRYIPWNTAWGELCKIHPTARYEFHENSDGLPFFESKFGIFVKVSVTIDELTHTMTRPVYDSRNQSMRSEQYEKQYGSKKITVSAATANDSIFCNVLAQNAVHAAMAGRTGFVVGYWNSQFTILPIPIAVQERKRISLEGELWSNVIETTGQPKVKDLY